MRCPALWPVIALVSFCRTGAVAQEVRCPAEVQPAAVTITAEKDWHPYIAYAFPLYGAGMSAGPPESERQLRGEAVDRKGMTTKYEFGRAGMEQGRWLDCRYGRAGELLVSRRLDDRLKRCTVTHLQLVPGEPRRISIVCE